MRRAAADETGVLRVVLITGSRSDWRCVKPVLEAAQADPEFEPRLIVTGTHLSSRHGFTADELPTAALRVPILDGPDEPLAIAAATGRGVERLANAIAAQRADWVVVVGDRYESFAGGLAATMLAIPLAHIGGGETDIATNQDCNLRNALTKLSQLHFVSHATAAERVRALGEEPWRVCVSGLPSLDDLHKHGRTWQDLAAAAPLDPARPFLLASFLPVTLRPAESQRHLSVLLGALDQLEAAQVLFVLSNGDATGDQHDAVVRAWASRRADAHLVSHLSCAVYAFALEHAACYVGNSSSGVIEAPLLGTPVVMVGSRQDGRPRAQNVRDEPNPSAASLATAIRVQLRHGRYSAGASPWGDGRAAARICARLKADRGKADLMSKRLVVSASSPCESLA